MKTQGKSTIKVGLWLRLAFSYFLLSFSGMSLLMLGSSLALNYRDFQLLNTPANITDAISQNSSDIALLVTKNASPTELQKAANNLVAKLSNLQLISSDQGTYRISTSSEPIVVASIWSQEIRVPIVSSSLNNVGLPKHGEYFLIQQNLKNIEGKTIGRLEIRFFAKFNWLREIYSDLLWVLGMWQITILTSFIISIVCGKIATSYVVKRLNKINRVVELWREGHFQEQIDLPANDELKQHGENLNEMAKKLSEYMEMKKADILSIERNRIARELHDTVKQKMFAASLHVGVLEKEYNISKEGYKSLTQVQTIIEDAQIDLRGMIDQLRPHILSENLSVHLEQIFERFRSLHPIAIDFRGMNLSLIALRHTHNLVRIIEESLSNVARHSTATQVFVEFEFENGQATLSIRDNGNGVYTALNKKVGFGLISMRERALELPSGEISFEEGLSSGYGVIVKWRLS